jgi:hypothetical protein
VSSKRAADLVARYAATLATRLNTETVTSTPTSASPTLLNQSLLSYSIALNLLHQQSIMNHSIRTITIIQATRTNKQFQINQQCRKTNISAPSPPLLCLRTAAQSASSSHTRTESMSHPHEQKTNSKSFQPLSEQALLSAHIPTEGAAREGCQCTCSDDSIDRDRGG